MKIYIPYSNYIQEATLISLKGYDRETVLMVSNGSYLKYFQERWEEEESFINIEHDVVPWPGAIDELEHCQELWCGYCYKKFELGNEYFGCVRFSQELIKLIPDVWNEREQYSKEYGNLDVHFSTYAKKCGIKFHQHFPSVIHLKEI
jgi:hypothetical protein